MRNKHSMFSKLYIGLLTISMISFQVINLRAQEKHTFNFEEALEIAKQNSPDIQQARFSLERSQENLNAQEASLKSRFGLFLEPFSYDKRSEFNTFFSQWNTTETKIYSGTLSISQPVIWTDGVFSINNRFGWLDSKSEFGGTDQTFSNNLYLSYEQPIFTYNRTKMGLDEVELDLENASLNYQLRELQLAKTVASLRFDW